MNLIKGNITKFLYALTATASIIIFTGNILNTQAQYSPLIIWGVNISNITSDSASIYWITNNAASGYVEYGTSSAYGMKTLPLINKTQYIIALPNLTSSTTYFFRIIAVDDSGFAASTSRYSFKTLALPTSSPAIIVSTTPTQNATSAIATQTTTPYLAQSPPSLPPATPPISTYLYFGLRGNEVKTLQQFLIARKYLAPGYDTGYFGSLTFQAVRAFQCANNIVCTGPAYGFVGPKTRNAINLQSAQSPS